MSNSTSVSGELVIDEFVAEDIEVAEEDIEVAEEDSEVAEEDIEVAEEASEVAEEDIEVTDDDEQPHPLQGSQDLPVAGTPPPQDPPSPETRKMSPFGPTVPSLQNTSTYEYNRIICYCDDPKEVQRFWVSKTSWGLHSKPFLSLVEITLILIMALKSIPS